MLLAVRRALALFFILVFVIVAPTALAYARGFRFDFATRQLRQTGVALLHGLPKNVVVSLDGQGLRATSLPRTYRSLTPGLHTIQIAATGYTTQNISFAIQPGQTTYLTNTQLVRTDPLVTVRTGLPANAQLSPAGSTVGWIEKGAVTLASLAGFQHTQTVANAQSLAWVGSTLVIFDEKKQSLGTLSSTGLFTPGAPQPEILPAANLNALAQTAGLTFTHAQRLEVEKSWLLTNAEGAWLLEENGSSTLISRWIEQPLSAKILKGTMFLTVRPNELTLRNLTNNQTQAFTQKGIATVADTPVDGNVYLLVRDGDLRTWMAANFF